MNEFYHHHLYYYYYYYGLFCYSEVGEECALGCAKIQKENTLFVLFPKAHFNCYFICIINYIQPTSFICIHAQLLIHIPTNAHSIFFLSSSFGILFIMNVYERRAKKLSYSNCIHPFSKLDSMDK